MSNHLNFNFSDLLNSDMIIEILRRLPVKSLIRFCSVCKSWKTLIRFDHGFIKSHLEQSLHSNPSSHNNVLIYSEPEFRKNHALKCRNPKMVNLFLGPHFVFVGCSNGILCYYSKFSISNSINVHPWNPATHKFGTLPQGSCRGIPPKGYDEFEVVVVFVFDPVNDDYKVMKIHYRRHPSPPVLVGEVYSLSANSWKTLNLSSFPSERLVGSNIVAHNGALHCITVPASGYRAVLSVFDIDEERVDEVSLPDCEYKTKPMPRLGPFKEFLSLSVWREDFEVWVMKEYGVWIKQFVLVNTPDIHSPYGMTASGKILAVTWHGEDVLYDAERRSVQECVQNKVVFIKANIYYFVTDTDHVVVADYVESLISVLSPVETTNN